MSTLVAGMRKTKKKTQNQYILAKLPTCRLDYSDQATMQALAVPGPTN